MKLIEKILLAHDFTETADHVVKAAVKMAKVFDAKILLVHVLPDDITNEKVRSMLKETAVKKLDEAAAEIKKHEVEIEDLMLLFGTAYDKIVQAGDESNVNLILIGSGERHGDDAYHLGLTAKHIIQKSELPVFVVKEGVELDVKKILCPVDFSATSSRALKNAIIIARRMKAELIILNIVEHQSTAWLAPTKDQEAENQKKYERQEMEFSDYLKQFNLADLEWRKELRQGDPSELILKEVKNEEIGLLIMGTTGKTGLNRLIMGSVAEKVVRQVPCPFLVLKSEDVIQLQLENRLRDLENHYHVAQQLMADGFYKESIDEFKKCLLVNNMHIPSYYGIANVYKKMGDTKQEERYRANGKEILDRIWDKKIEEEIRKFYNA